MLNDKNTLQNTEQTGNLRTPVFQGDATDLQRNKFEMSDIKKVDAHLIQIFYENLINLPKNRLVTAKEILGEVLWDEYLPMETHRFIGNRISFLVKQNRLPLVFKSFNSSRHNQYQVLETFL